MKKIFTQPFFALIISLLSGFSAFGQTAITITAADMPVPTGPYNLDEITGLVSNQTIANDGTWDFSAFNGNLPNSVDYYPETIPFFTDAGVDAYRLVTKTLTSGFGYYIYQEVDFNDDAVDDIAVDVPAQGYTLQPFTGNIGDSLLIPAQSYIYDTYRRFIQFPMTANSTWSSSSRRTADMYIHVPAFGLNYAPIQQAYTWVRNDAIVGWGKMRVYTPDGPSVQYDVLVDKITEYATDSMYLNGAPAPTQLLTAFGITQGQKTNM
ncbi:MAG: hypothetical protein IT258_20910, partial [Saprospiraceae bacterium]|nr:hypothetical protein [Saprospiraceae bacterium]